MVEPSKSLLARLLTMPDEEDEIGFSYDEAKSLARHPDPGVRISLAAREDVVPEVLYFLASDPDPNVRRNLAGNRSTPRQADYMLAGDADAHVRADLARKIARLSPGLTPAEHDRIRHTTYLTLEKLARDQMPMVRHAISDTIKNMPNVPKCIVNKLARDLDIIVAAPVLEFSPILTDDDLLSIINANPIVGALSAISRRRNVSATVSHGIAISHDVDAMITLLENDSAQIREDTLNLLIDQSADHTQMQPPLARRANLPPQAAQRLAVFVTDHVLHALAARQDLPPDTLNAIDCAVKTRLKDFPMSGMPDPIKEQLAVDSQMDRVKRLNKSGQISDVMFTDAMAEPRDHAFAKAMLAVCSSLPTRVVLDILASNSPKAVVALTWAAGFNMHHAEQAQSQLAHIRPGNIIHSPDGKFPLTEGELHTQIAIFRNNVA
jgi:uncharacterized protein (DUF2336 family)